MRRWIWQINKTWSCCRWHRNHIRKKPLFRLCVPLLCLLPFSPFLSAISSPHSLSLCGRLIISDCTAGFGQMWILYSSEHRLYTFISSHSPQQCKCHVAVLRRRRGSGGGGGCSSPPRRGPHPSLCGGKHDIQWAWWSTYCWRLAAEKDKNFLCNVTIITYLKQFHPQLASFAH